MSFKKVVITLPYCYAGESDDVVGKLADSGVWRVHIRKPEASERDVRNLIESIPLGLRCKVSIHDRLSLAGEYSLGGVHLNSRSRDIPPGWTGLVSQSLHSVGEIGDFRGDYAFLSPIYPSISKPGYRGCYDWDELKKSLDDRILALGGVVPEKFDELRSVGFGGVAMLGAAWRTSIDEEAFKLQFITHRSERFTLEKEVQLVTAGGCRWVQLRMKDAEISGILSAGRRIAQICRDKGCVFIIDDHVGLVNQLGADGVHLGKNDMPVKEARQLLGPSKIIGATANTFDDVREACIQGADYVGVGPFRFTETKKNLSPILGAAGYRTIVAECRRHGITVPIVAIGGITLGDVPLIMSTGVQGIALSGEILGAEDPQNRTERIIRELNIINRTI